MNSEIVKPKLIFEILDNVEQAKLQILEDESLVYITLDEYQQTILHLVAQTGNAELLQFIIEHPKTDVERRDYGGNTALHYACKSSNPEVVNILLNNKSDVNAKNKKLQTPLHIAAMSKSKLEAAKMTKLLLEKGADANVQDIKTTKRGDLQKKPYSMQLMQSLLPFSKAEEFDDFRIVQIKGFTPLHYAIANENIECVRCLCELGADLSIKDEAGGFTALLLCVSENKNPEILRMLLSFGSKYADTDSEGETVLHIASTKGNLDIVEILLEQKIDIDVRNAKGQTSVQLACREGQLEVVRKLLEEGANASLEDNFGISPIHEACSFGQLEAVKLLVNLGDNVDINRPAKNFPNSTPLHIASANNYTELAQYLIEKNAHLLAKDAEGNTPIDVAPSDEMRSLFNDYVQVKLVHERTLVIKKEALDEELINQFQATEKIYGNTILEFHNGNHSFTFTNKENSMNSISREISKDSKTEAFLLLSTSDHKALKMRVRIKGENRYRVVAIDRTSRSIEKLKNAIVNKYGDRRISQVQRILLWPDKLAIELVDDYDCELLEESCEIEIETL